MAARDDFADRIAAYRQAAIGEAVQVKPPSEVSHNAGARLLRNGLAVVGFATLEDFLKRRLGEVLGSVSVPALRFSDLPSKLQNATTVGVMEAVAFQADLRRRAGQDHVAFIQAVAADVASTRTSAFALSEISFGYARSNVSADDYKLALSAFLIKSCWGEVGELAKRVGLGAPTTYDVAFQSASSMRHRAAHNGATDTAAADLVDFSRTAVGLALGFDALISRAARLLRERNAAFLESKVEVKAAGITLRFVDADATGNWREITEGGARATSVSSDVDVAFTKAIGHARKNRQLVVVRGPGSIPLRWYPTDDA